MHIQNIENKTDGKCWFDEEIRGLFGTFVEFGLKIFKHLNNPFIFFDISQVDINELASIS